MYINMPFFRKNIMDKLKNLLTLISDGRPTKERINEEIDEYIDIFQEKLFNRSQYDLSRLLFKGNVTIHEMKDLFITCQYSHYNAVLDDVEVSIERYAPFLKINPEFRRLQSGNDCSSTIHYKIPLIFEITPEMKSSMKSIMLQKELDKSLCTNIGSLKKQSKL
jgi:hypothetical protein